MISTNQSAVYGRILTNESPLFLPEEIEKEYGHYDGELEGEGYEGNREVVVEIMAAAYHRSEEN